MTEVKKVPKDYQNGALVGSENQRPKIKVKKECFGCGDNFICSQKENYDYCPTCELNGSRYIPRQSQCPERSPGYFTKCPECGNGSGIIKFPNQPPRSCKSCFLTSQETKGKSTNWSWLN